ncbi:Bax protein [Hydrogenimonas sp.]|nr:Bax protein [Hydrogenimonas sp.]
MYFRLWPVLLLILLIAGCTTPGQKHEERVERSPKLLYYSVNSYRQTMQILDNLGYTDSSFKAGMIKIPRVLITRISKRWKEQADKIPVEIKKSIFLRLMASGALIADEEILKERKKLLSILKELSKGPISRKESAWLRETALKYKVLKDRGDILTREKLHELVRRVDIVPPSIIVAQAAVESGWGTSRFAVEGNALFGQWSFSDNAMKPKEQRAHLGNYGLATFKTPLDSIRSYLLNINTHPAYRSFRYLRSEMRAHGVPLRGEALVHTLEHYSERKKEYIEDLNRIIRTNRLSWLDSAELQNNRPVVIHPDR